MSEKYKYTKVNRNLSLQKIAALYKKCIIPQIYLMFELIEFVTRFPHTLYLSQMHKLYQLLSDCTHFIHVMISRGQINVV